MSARPRVPNRPQTFGGAVYLVVSAIVATGMVVVAFGHWRKGIGVIGLSLVAASIARLLLREQDAGMLRVRSRMFDVAVLAGVGLALIVLATNIPNQTGV